MRYKIFPPSINLPKIKVDLFCAKSPQPTVCNIQKTHSKIGSNFFSQNANEFFAGLLSSRYDNQRVKNHLMSKTDPLSRLLVFCQFVKPVG
jgi:hypothetical protein